jgi:hypothetical protein
VRVVLESASRDEKVMAFARGATDMEAVFWSLHRAMRVGEALARSAETTVSLAQLPSSSDRDKLRKMRNAIDHADGPIVLGRAGKGEALTLLIGSDDMSISDEDGVTQMVTHTEFAQWTSPFTILRSLSLRDPRTGRAHRRRRLPKVDDSRSCGP